MLGRKNEGLTYLSLRQTAVRLGVSWDHLRAAGRQHEFFRHDHEGFGMGRRYYYRTDHVALIEAVMVREMTLAEAAAHWAAVKGAIRANAVLGMNRR